MSKEQNTKPTIDLYEKKIKSKEYLKKESLDERLIRLKNMYQKFIFEESEDKKHIRVKDYILTFRDILDVKTLRVGKVTEPPMYLFGDGYYITGVEHYFKESSNQMFGSMMTPSRVSAMMQRLHSYSYVEPDYFEHFNQNLLNLQNCVLDLETLRFYPYNPEYKMTTILPIKYDPNAKNSEFEDFVAEIVDKDNEKVLQEIYGYCLYRAHPIQKAFMLYGKGADGKTQWLLILKALLGKENCSYQTLHALVEDEYRLAELHKKYANISPDLPSTKLIKNDMFRALTGGDTVSAARKYGHPFNFVNYAKLIFPANQLPFTSDDTYAFWRRWIIIEFPNRFEGTNAVKDINIKLTDTPEKLSGILNYAIEGLQSLIKNDLEFSYSKTTKEVQEEWQRCADTVNAFMELKLESDSEGEILTTKLLEKYEEFCKSMELVSLAENKFWKEWKRRAPIQFHGIEKKQYGSGELKGKYYWNGIRFK